MAMVIWSREHCNWIELTPEEEDAMADYGDAVAEGRMTEDEVIDLILSQREALEYGDMEARANERANAEAELLAQKWYDYYGGEQGGDEPYETDPEEEGLEPADSETEFYALHPAD